MITHFFSPFWWRFQWRYWRGQTPWDTQITPPEVMEFIAETPPAKALDLGCGTGTNAVTLARNGWKVTGVDFVPKAIRTARRKAAAYGYAIDFYLASVTDLSMLSGPYDYALDIGCFFGLKVSDRNSYAAELSRLLASDAWYMLYAWHPRCYKGKWTGISAEEVDGLLEQNFTRERVVVGEEGGHPSAWYWYRRK